MLKKYTGKLYCFSPPVMLATFLIEFGLAFYTIFRYKLTTVSRLIVSLLLCLGIFQLAEFMVCGADSPTTEFWSRFGYMCITMLPALGIHLVVTIAQKKQKLLVAAAYLTCSVFVLFFALAPNAIDLNECLPNYAIFSTASSLEVGWAYYLYYYGWVILGAVLSFIWAEKSESKQALYWLFAGYMAFVVPTTLINILLPDTKAGIPSIMCGFAVILALILALCVLPRAGQKHH